ncbi:MAG: DUF2059 domain-containing protein [Opitutaceae bacterium]
MKSPKQLLLLITLGLSSLCAQAEENSTILLRGLLDLGSSQMFSLSTSDGGSSTWVKIGQSYKEHKLVSFDAEAQALTLDHNGEKVTLTLAAAEIAENAEGTMEERLSEAETLMTMMNFEKMMDETMDAQMKAMSDMMRKQMSAGGSVDEELLDFQTKAMAEMFEAIDWEPIKNGMSKAYAETFTKDELSSITSFYATPAGQATIAKQPAIQEKTMTLMMPAIMEASQTMQQKMMQFYQDRKAAK